MPSPPPACPPPLAPPPPQFLLPGGSLSLLPAQRGRRRRALAVSLTAQLALAAAVVLALAFGPPVLPAPSRPPRVWVEVLTPPSLHYVPPPRPHRVRAKVMLPPAVRPPRPDPPLTIHHLASPVAVPVPPARVSSERVAPTSRPRTDPRLAPALALPLAPELPVPPAPVVLGAFGAPDGLPSTPGKTVAAPELGSFGRGTTATPAPPPAAAVAGAGFGAAAVATASAGSGAAVRSADFGTARSGPVAGSGATGAVALNGFGAARPAPSRLALVPPPAVPDFTPPVVLSWPKPEYTAEALAHHLEGEVVLNVRLRADGGVEVLNVVHSLGYGLDERARAAAAQLNFRPARRGGSPVDFTARITVTFRLAN